MNNRRSIRLSTHDYSLGIYFITLVTHKRQRLFGKIINGEMILSAAGEEVRNQWLNLVNLRPNIRLDEFVVMPYHFHALIWIKSSGHLFEDCLTFIAPGRTSRKFSGSHGPTLMAIIGSYKAGVSRLLRLFNDSFATVWQRNYYERILWNETQLEIYRNYIRDNPKNWKD